MVTGALWLLLGVLALLAYKEGMLTPFVAVVGAGVVVGRYS